MIKHIWLAATHFSLLRNDYFLVNPIASGLRELDFTWLIMVLIPALDTWKSLWACACVCPMSWKNGEMEKVLRHGHTPWWGCFLLPPPLWLAHTYSGIRKRKNKLLWTISSLCYFLYLSFSIYQLQISFIFLQKVWGLTLFLPLLPVSFSIVMSLFLVPLLTTFVIYQHLL